MNIYLSEMMFEDVISYLTLSIFNYEERIEKYRQEAQSVTKNESLSDEEKTDLISYWNLCTYEDYLHIEKIRMILNKFYEQKNTTSKKTSLKNTYKI